MNKSFPHVRFMSLGASVKLYFLCHSYDSMMNMFGQVTSGEVLFFFFSESRFFLKISWIMEGNKLCRTRQRNKGKGVASASNQRQQIPSEK